MPTTQDPRPTAGQPAPGLVRALGVAVWVAAAILGGLTLRRGWLPHDAGALGQAAERVLTGQLPHRDFFATYTGGLAMLDALAFKVLGISILSMRLAFLATYLLWVPLFWGIARRLTSPWIAAVATLAAVAGTLPAYPEGMPSWFNLFLATAGIWALLRHTADGRVRWLVVAGAAGGLSILFKIIGLYYLAGACLYLLYLEDSRAVAAVDKEAAPAASDLAYRTVMMASLALSAAAITALVVRVGSVAALVYFALPPAAAIAAVGGRLLHPSGRDSAARFRALAGLLGSLTAGAALPVVLFMLPYVGAGALHALVEGVFILPQRRFRDAVWSPPPLLGLVPPLLVAGWVVAAPTLTRSRRRPMLLVGGALLVAWVMAADWEPAYRGYWWILSCGGVAASVAAAVAIARRFEGREAAVLALSVFALHNLVQVPFAAPIYALYAFPLLVLLALAFAGPGVPARRGALAGVMVSLLLFTAWRVDTGFVYHLGFRYRPHTQKHTLEIPRAGGIRVTQAEKNEYETLVHTVQELDPGPYILAFPDSPEVYFLTGTRNPTRSLFDFLDPDQAGRTGRILEALDRQDVRVVVVNRRPLFSGPPDPGLLNALQARYPQAREVGRFLVAWKPSAPSE